MTGIEKMKKVKLVQLSMLKEPWEHGTAAQAFMESGDEKIALLMAHEAVFRQKEDGRLAVVGDREYITDPCVCGQLLCLLTIKLGKKNIN